MNDNEPNYSRPCEQEEKNRIIRAIWEREGLDAQHFTSGDPKVRWLYEDSARKLHASSPALSTTSTASSSGFNSWASDQNNAKEDVTLTPSVPPQKTEQKEAVIMYEGRDLLDLGSNLRDPRWNYQPSELPKDPQHFFSNRSQYSRVNGDQVPLHVDVPCEFCDFVIPYYD